MSTKIQQLKERIENLAPRFDFCECSRCLCDDGCGGANMLYEARKELKALLLAEMPEAKRKVAIALEHEKRELEGAYSIMYCMDMKASIEKHRAEITRLSALLETM